MSHNRLSPTSTISKKTTFGDAYWFGCWIPQ